MSNGTKTLKELDLDVMCSKHMMYSPIGAIHGMWKQRCYTSIKELALNVIHKFFYKKGVEDGWNLQQKHINDLKESTKEIIDDETKKTKEVIRLRGVVDDLDEALNKMVETYAECGASLHLAQKELKEAREVIEFYKSKLPNGKNTDEYYNGVTARRCEQFLDKYPEGNSNE